MTVSDLCLSNPLWLPQGEDGLEWQGKEGAWWEGGCGRRAVGVTAAGAEDGEKWMDGGGAGDRPSGGKAESLGKGDVTFA